MRTPVELTKGGSDTDAIDYTTASITPTTGRTVLAAIEVLDLGSAVARPTCTGCSLTWTRIDEVGTATNRFTMFRASATSPTAGSVTFAGCVTAGQTADGAAWYIAEIANTDLTTTDGVLQADTGSTTNDNWTGGELALGAFRDANSGTVFIMGAYDNAGGTVNNAAGTGFTELSEVSQSAGGDTITLSLNYALGNVTTAVATTSAANDRLLGCMVEIGIAQISPTGSIASSGAMVRQTNKLVAGAVTPAGAITKVVAKTPAGTVTPTGAVVKKPTVTYTGAFTPTGALTKRPNLTQAGSITPTGAITKQIARSLSGSITPTSTLRWLVSLTKSGSITPSGTLSKRAEVTLAGTVTPAGGIVRRVEKILAGALGLAGSLVTATVVTEPGAEPSGLAGTTSPSAPSGVSSPTVVAGGSSPSTLTGEISPSETYGLVAGNG